MSDTIAKLLYERRSDKLKDKDNIWKLVYESYQGGPDYINGSNLFQYHIEDNLRYKLRLKRADYTNHTQQLIDMLRGFIYAKPVKRYIDETKYQYIHNDISKGKSMQSFISMIATNFLKSTVGILVDSPQIPEGMSEAERRELNLNPYAVYYSPFHICDYEYDDRGELLWVILDNSYIDKTDPEKPAEKKNVKRLWTREYYRDIYKENDGNGNSVYRADDPTNHDLNVVPFIFANCRDTDDDYICDSPFEDIALKSRTVFNINSWCDETLAGSAFNVLFYPYETMADIDKISELFGSGGIADISVYPFNGKFSAPVFGGPKLEGIDKYISKMNHTTAEILGKFGIKQDPKGFWESGVAKEIDFEKTEAFLRDCSEQLQSIEERIVGLCGLWEGAKIDAEISYPFEYSREDIEKELSRLNEAFTIPSKKVQEKAYSEKIKLLFPGVDPGELEELVQDIQETQGVPAL